MKLFIVLYIFYFPLTNSLPNEIVKVESINFCDIIEKEFPLHLNDLLNYDLKEEEINNFDEFLIQLLDKDKFFNSEKIYKELNYKDPYIADLGVDPAIIENLRVELIKAISFSKRLGKYIPETLVPTTHFDTKFSLVAFMLPSMPEFLRQASKKIYEIVPDFTGMHINAFLVEEGAKSEMVHNQGNHGILDNFKVFDEKIWPDLTNIHIALNDLNENRQPFIFFKNTEKLIITPRYAYQILLENGLIAKNETLLYEKALFLAENAWDHKNFQLKDRIHPGAFTILEKLYNFKYCGKDRQNSLATEVFWGNATKGNAVVFSPYMLHGGSVFPPAKEPRYSLVLRSCNKEFCFPWAKKVDEDRGFFLNGIYWGFNLYKKLQTYNKMNECYKKIFNYPESSTADLLKLRAKTLKLEEVIDLLDQHYSQENTKEWLNSQVPNISDEALVCIKDFYRDFLGKEVTINYEENNIFEGKDNKSVKKEL